MLKMRVDQASALAWVAVVIAYWCIPSIKGMSGGRNRNARFSQPKNSTVHGAGAREAFLGAAGLRPGLVGSPN
jgi:hypothetical protein